MFIEIEINLAIVHDMTDDELFIRPDAVASHWIHALAVLAFGHVPRCLRHWLASSTRLHRICRQSPITITPTRTYPPLMGQYKASPQPQPPRQVRARLPDERP